MKQTKCIHIPTLWWGESARIIWAEIEDCERYVLKRRVANDSGEFPEEYETICDGAHFSVETKLSTDDRYSMYANHNTYAWADIDSDCISWDTVSENGYTWGAIQDYAGPVPHLGFDDQIPEEVSLAEYRLIIHYANGESEIISSGILPVLGDDFEDVASRIVSAGDLAYYQINAKGMTALDKLLQITFNRDELELEHYYSGRLEPVSQEDGVIVFRLTRDISEDLEWAGLVVVLNFRALASCESQVNMETMDVK